MIVLKSANEVFDDAKARGCPLMFEREPDNSMKIRCKKS
jgi:hypothetical protein